MQPQDKTTHFGYRTIPANEKRQMVRDLFSGVSSRYDLMNDAMSGGMHRLWKDALVDWLHVREGQFVLDVAGGTGDVAMRMLGRNPGARVTVLDLTEEMLEKGRARVALKMPREEIAWVVGDALNMPFPDGSFDACTLAFGIRNFADLPKSLDEVLRVLKIGGRMLVLEFSAVRPSGLRRLYDRYSFGAIPAMGKAIAGDRDSYSYLVESIRKFPNQETFADMIRETGFENVTWRNLSLGVAAIHSAWKI